jgi:hypothetical protein
MSIFKLFYAPVKIIYLYVYIVLFHVFLSVVVVTFESVFHSEIY